MATRRQGTVRTQTERRMRKLLAECRRSGLTQAAFARRHRMTPGLLAWWKHEIRRRDEQRVRQDEPTSFVPVEVSPSVTATPSGTSLVFGSGLDFGVELVNGIRIQVPAHFDGDALKQLVEVLRQC